MKYAASPRCFAMLRKFEGFRAAPAPLPDGGWVVGYGHVRLGGAGTRLTKAEASELLALDIAPLERLVSRALKVAVVQSQFDALVSFAFSVGAPAFLASNVLRELNDGAPAAAARAMFVAAAAGPHTDALLLRRAAETAMFLKDAPDAAAPSALVRAQISPAARLTDILRSEPATEALLLSQPVSPQAEPELNTAHAAPVARRVPSWRLPRLRFNVGALSENFGLLALLGFGGALTLAGSSIVIDGNAVDLVAGGALVAPGLAAIAMSGYGLWRGGPQSAEA